MSVIKKGEGGCWQLSTAKERSHGQIIHFNRLENFLRNTFFSHLLPKDLLS